MSSDPFADLARTLEAFAASFGIVVHSYPKGHAPGSAGHRDCTVEKYAGGWGNAPIQTAVTMGLLGAVSCVDHLMAAATLIPSRMAVTSPSTVMRGAVEAAARSCYVLDSGINEEERVRRGMNVRLESLHDSIRALSPFKSDPDASARIAYYEARIDVIGQTASAFGLSFKAADKLHPARIGTALPSATRLIDDYVSDVPDMGRIYYQRLSAIAHSRPHGFMDLMKRQASEASASGAPGASGFTTMAMTVTPAECALHLLAGPLATITLMGHGEEYLGWDVGAVEKMTVRLTNVWGRIAKAPYPGAQFTTDPPSALKRQ